ncbi:MAG: hypothetical protein ACYC3X_15910 [Pirellulaceae bacterium]
MTLSVKAFVAVVVVAGWSLGMGLSGLSGPAAGQESGTAETITDNNVADSIAPAPPDVPVVVVHETSNAASPEAATGQTPASTNRRLQAFQTISAALDEETLMEFNDAPLSEVVDYLKSVKNIPIVLERRGLENAGMGSDTPISVSLNGIALRSCLARILGELDLDYVIANEALVITSKEAARTQLDPRIYQTAGLRIAEDKLIEIIVSMIAPDTWEETGGTGKITSLGDESHGLAIAQTDQIHDQITDLLEKLRRADGASNPPSTGE